MPHFLHGPAISNIPPQTVQYFIVKNLPDSFVSRHIIGIQYYNNSPWDVNVQGIAGDFNLRPYSSKYIPNLANSNYDVYTPLNFATTQNDLVNFPLFSFQGGYIDFLIFFDGDLEPNNAYIDQFRGLQTAIAGAVVQQPATLFAVSGVIGAGAALSLTLSSSVGPFVGLYLTQLAYSFGVPSAVPNGFEITLKDGLGQLWESYHINIGIAPMKALNKVINFVNPLLAPIVSNLSSFVLAVPAVASNSSYQCSLRGFAF
jgi:hypothetical protein